MTQEYLPEGWKRVRLKSVTREIKQRNSNHAFTVADVLGVSNKIGFYPNNREIKDDVSRYKIITHHDFGYNPMRLNVGSLAYRSRPESGLISPDYVAFRCDTNQLLPEYFNYFRQTSDWWHQIENGGQGGVRIRYYYNDIANFTISLPPIDEQRRIAEVLRDADANIVDIEEAITAVEQIRKGFLERFICELEQIPPTRLNKALVRVKHEVEIDPKQLYYQIGIRSHGKGIFHKEAITGKELGNKKIYWVEPGDFVLNIVFAWEGAVALVSEHERGMCGSHRFPTFRFNTDICLPEFLLFYFKTPKGVRQLEDVSPGGAGRNKTLNQGDFLKLKIPFPDLEVQQEIVASLQTLTDTILTMQTEAASVREVKRGLMQKLLSGQVRV